MSDNYGNKLPTSPSYPNLAAIIAAHSSRIYFVSQGFWYDSKIAITPAHVTDASGL